MAPTIALILDLLVAGLLIATIIYAVTLNRRLIELQESRSELEGLIRSFGEATARAEAGTKAMKRTAAETGEALQKNLERGKALRDELQFMIEAADALAQRLAEAPTAARGPVSPIPARRPVTESPRMDSSRSDSPRPDPPRPEPSRLDTLRSDTLRSDALRADPPRFEPSRAEVRRPPALDLDGGGDLPRGRGALARLESFVSDPPKAEPPRPEPPRLEPSRSEPSRSGARPSLDLDGGGDLPRGRGALARLESFVAESSRAEGPSLSEPDEGRESRGWGPPPRTDSAASESPRRSGGKPDAVERGAVPSGVTLADESRPARREGTEGLSRAERELLEAMENRR
jgi:hypothetical protein